MFLVLSTTNRLSWQVCLHQPRHGMLISRHQNKRGQTTQITYNPSILLPLTMIPWQIQPQSPLVFLVPRPGKTPLAAVKLLVHVMSSTGVDLGISQLQRSSSLWKVCCFLQDKGRKYQCHVAFHPLGIAYNCQYRPGQCTAREPAKNSWILKSLLGNFSQKNMTAVDN